MTMILILVGIATLWIVGTGAIGALVGGDLSDGIGAVLWFLVWSGVCLAAAMFFVGRWWGW